MSYKIIFATFLSLIISTSAAFARTGVESGGGGDPLAVDFLLKVRVVAEWVKTGAAAVDESVKERVYSTARQLSIKMDQADQTPIIMVNKNLTDASGASKVALYNLNTFKIEVTRSKWKNLNEEEKYITAGLELFGLAEVPERYQVAGVLQNDIQRAMQLSAVVGAQKDLAWPQWIYFALAEAFPEFDESIGGFSREISLKSLICSNSNNSSNNGAPIVITECTATNLFDQQLTRPAINLFNTLLNSGAILDSRSEPGTVYIELENVDCGVLEPRSTDPSIPVEPEYYCSGKIVPPIDPE